MLIHILILSNVESSGAKNCRISVERPVAPVSLTIIYPGWRFAYPRLIKFDPFWVKSHLQNGRRNPAKPIDSFTNCQISQLLSVSGEISVFVTDNAIIGAKPDNTGFVNCNAAYIITALPVVHHKGSP